ncbi:Rrf2 family transcriptional regulator [Desulfovibrio psychrotolerans]|uniref:Protein rrf2 n=1 Tax=Desulfovibrio psychrotolerans TaxID=415242 RepID=A0A7J0BUK3_9BACT|nr:RrF2 family transcriptional regulator [Desulfovibrio psychrotolerans]GFM36845.1 protein rrf2 [Desulfovibrio psychrotolerans]
MKLTTRSRYGTRMLLDIAMNQEDGPVSIKDIALRQEISLKYLEKLMRVLKKEGYIKSRLGAHGGYILARDPADIPIGDVAYALEKTAPCYDCDERQNCCPRMHVCLTRTIWEEGAKALYNKLNTFTLADLIRDTSLCPKNQPDSVPPRV